MHEEFRFNKKENFLHNAIRFVPGMEFYSNGESMKALLTWSSLAMIPTSSIKKQGSFTVLTYT
jgi:hypothetical protein